MQTSFALTVSSEYADPEATEYEPKTHASDLEFPQDLLFFSRSSAFWIDGVEVLVYLPKHLGKINDKRFCPYKWGLGIRAETYATAHMLRRAQCGKPRP